MPLYVEQFQHALAEERRKRQAFYNDMTEDDKAEFINGEVVFQSLAKLRHVVTARNLLSLVDIFLLKHDVGFVGNEKLLVSLARNDYEPDICFFRKEKAEQFSDDQMQFPAPDFVVEVLSPSTEHRDRGVKFEDYAAHGIMEYWIIDAENQVVEQYILYQDTYQLKTKARAEVIQSIAIPGFAVPIRAIFDEDERLATLQRIIVG